MARLKTDPEAARKAAADQFALSDWIDTAPFEDLLDLRIERAENGSALLRMPFKVKHCQGGGLLHGGAMTTLADTAVAMAIKSLLPPGTRFATTELTMEFLAPVLEGEVSAAATVEQAGERLFTGIALLRDSLQKPVARFSSTFRVARDAAV